MESGVHLPAGKYEVSRAIENAHQPVPLLPAA
jgi:hypothetical protein